MIWIISGPSCAGKSTLLASNHFLKLSGLSTRPPLVFAHSVGSPKFKLDPAQKFALHYNTLRPLKAYLYTGQSLPEDSFLENTFLEDPAWRLIRDSAIPKKAIVLTCSKETLVRRARSRKLVNTSGLREESNSKYFSKKWIELIRSMDINALHIAWCQHLEQSKIDYQIINSQEPYSQELERLVA